MPLDLTVPSWMFEAACLGQADGQHDPWHPGDPRQGWDAAREVCATCPVLDDCLAYALGLVAASGIQVIQGMFAALTRDELAAEARQRGIPLRRVALHGTRARYVGHDGGNPPPCRCGPCRRANMQYEAARRARVA